MIATYSYETLKIEILFVNISNSDVFQKVKALQIRENSWSVKNEEFQIYIKVIQKTKFRDKKVHNNLI